MGQEFTINSSVLEAKINQLFPSQGGFGAGVDLSASTTVIPIVDLTESAEGSQLRSDLQTSFSLNSISQFNVSNTTTTIINTTGYFRIYGTVYITGGGFGYINLTDGTTTKQLQKVNADSASQLGNEYFDFNVFLQAGQSVTAQSNGTNITVIGVSRQLADLDGNLVNPI